LSLSKEFASTAPFYRLGVDLLPKSLNDNSTALSFIEAVERSVLARHLLILPIVCINSTEKFNGLVRRLRGDSGLRGWDGEVTMVWKLCGAT